MPASAIEQALQRAETVRLFPSAAMRIQSVATDSRSSLADLERAVALDAALAALLLKLANSAYYGMPRGVATLRQAIQVLGFRATQDLALALALLSLGHSAHPLRKELTRHSMRTGAAAQSLARSSRSADPGEAFVAGLVHDIGALLMLELWPGQSEAILRAQEPDRRLGAEHAAFGFDHALLGAACLERWSLPPSICAAVRGHHDSEPPAASGLASAVWMANALDEGHAVPGLAELMRAQALAAMEQAPELD